MSPGEDNENQDQDSPPTVEQRADAPRVARRFAAAWLAHAVGRAPISTLSDALPDLQRRLDVVRGRQPTSATPPAPRARLVSLRRLRPANPRLLVATVQITASRELRRADLLLVWVTRRWRVADVAPR